MAVENVKQWLLVMNTDNKGKISKQRWMAFMGAQFDRLDVEKKGELDQTAIRQSIEYVKHARFSDPRKVTPAPEFSTWPPLCCCEPRESGCVGGGATGELFRGARF